MNKLVLEYDFEFDLFGIISSAKEYKLGWAVNNALGACLAKQSDIRFDFAKKDFMLISNFEEQSEHFVLRLFKNKAVEFEGVKKPFLIPEKQEFDFFLQIEGEYEKYNSEEVARKLSELSIVQLFTTVDTMNLPSKENLIY